MKFSHIIVTLLFFFQINSIFGSTTPDNDSLEVFYILDEVYKPFGKHFKTDNYIPSYFSVKNGEVIISENSILSIAMFGNIKNIQQSSSANTDSVITFYIIGKRQYVGLIRSVEITYKNKNEIKIHFYNKLGMQEFFFNAHVASTDEIIKINNYLIERDN